MDVGLTATASLGALLCMIRKRLEGRFILVLSAAYFLFFVTYRALFIEHVVIVVPLLAIMSGIGLVTPLNLWWKEARGGDVDERKAKVKVNARRNSMPVLPVISLSLSVFYALAAVPLAWNDSILISPADDSRGQDVLTIIRVYSNETDYIITDSQTLAFIAGRDVPPDLVDTSSMRISSGYLDSNDVIRSTEEYRVKVIAFCTGRLVILGEFLQYVKASFKLIGDFEGCQVYGRSVSSVSYSLYNIQSTGEFIMYHGNNRSCFGNMSRELATREYETGPDQGITNLYSVVFPPLLVLNSVFPGANDSDLNPHGRRIFRRRLS